MNIWRTFLRTYPNWSGELKNCYLVIDGNDYYSKLAEKFVRTDTFGLDNLRLALTVLHDVEEMWACNVHTVMVLQKWGKPEFDPTANDHVDNVQENVILNEPVRLLIMETLYTCNLFLVLSPLTDWKICHGIAQRLQCPLMTWTMKNLLNQPYLGNTSPIVYPTVFTKHVRRASDSADSIPNLRCRVYMYDGDDVPIKDTKKLPLLHALDRCIDYVDLRSASREFNRYSDRSTKKLFKWIDSNKLSTCLSLLEPKSLEMSEKFYEEMEKCKLDTDQVKRTISRLTIIFSSVSTLSCCEELKFSVRQKPLVKEASGKNAECCTVIRYDWPTLTILGLHKEPVDLVINSLCFHANTALKSILGDMMQTDLYQATAQVLSVLGRSLMDDYGFGDLPMLVGQSTEMSTSGECVELQIEDFSKLDSFPAYMEARFSLHLTDAVGSKYAQYLASLLAAWIRTTDAHTMRLSDSAVGLAVTACSLAAEACLSKSSRCGTGQLGDVIERFTAAQLKLEAFINVKEENKNEQMEFQSMIADLLEFSLEIRRLLSVLDLTIVYGSTRLETVPITSWPSQKFFEFQPTWILLPNTTLVYVLSRTLSGVSSRVRLKYLTETWLPEMVVVGTLHTVQLGLSEVIEIVDNSISADLKIPD